MLIRFLKPDPRRGTVADMDSSLGQQMVDAGRAEFVTEAKATRPPETKPDAPEENKAITTMENKADKPRKGK